jgi:hypothetical protein
MSGFPKKLLFLIRYRMELVMANIEKRKPIYTIPSD